MPLKSAGGRARREPEVDWIARRACQRWCRLGGMLLVFWGRAVWVPGGGQAVIGIWGTVLFGWVVEWRVSWRASSVAWKWAGRV